MYLKPKEINSVAKILCACMIATSANLFSDENMSNSTKCVNPCTNRCFELLPMYFNNIIPQFHCIEPHIILTTVL